MRGSVRIDRVEVRVRGGSPEAARALARDLRAALHPALEAEVRRWSATAPRVARFEAPAVRPRRGVPADRTAAAVARAVADGVARSVVP
jgi:hypothetical protein